MMRIVWEDSRHMGGGWLTREEAADASQSMITTVAYLLHDYPDRYVLCQSLGRDYLQGVIVIPRSAVIEANELVIA
ncbi:MAG: hypothetical protein EOP83_07800 [Verrucomicrobiaceae bacterium]|nr:MAG: hypothetical protein EOP83_07800 [Verrucomicrobiaceae bacterium]